MWNVVEGDSWRQHLDPICRYTHTHTHPHVYLHITAWTQITDTHAHKVSTQSEALWKSALIGRELHGGSQKNVKNKDSDACRKGERWTLILKIASCVTAVLFFHYKLCGIISEMCCEDLCEVGRIKHPQLFIIKMPQNSRNILVLAHVLILCQGNFKYSSRKIRLCR